MLLNVFLPDQGIFKWHFEVPNDYTNPKVTELFGGDKIVSAVYRVPAGAVRLIGDEINDTQVENLIHQRLQVLEPAILSRTQPVVDVFSGHSENDLHLVIRTMHDWIFNIYRLDTNDEYEAKVLLEGKVPAVMHQAKIKSLLPEGLKEAELKQAKFYLAPDGTPTAASLPRDRLDLGSQRPINHNSLLIRLFKWGLRMEVIHLVLDVTTPSGLKRKASSELTPDIDQQIRSSRLAKTAPSSFSDSKVYKIFQKGRSTKILDDRPTSDPTPDLTLIYPGFARFVDRAELRVGEETAAGRGEGTADDDLKDQVDAFAKAMQKTYPNEDERKFVVHLKLAPIFGQSPDESAETVFKSNILSSGCTSDGHLLGRQGLPRFIMEIKEDDGNPGLAAAQATGHFAHLLKDHVLYLSFDPLAHRWKVPCLAMTIADHVVTFHALTLMGGQVCSVSLTPSISCVPKACGGLDRKRLYKAFSAASILLKEIDKDAELMERTTLSPIPPECCRTPGVFRLPKYKTSQPEQEWLYFQITEIRDDKQPDRQVYIAQTQEKETIIVKFARRYSIDVHELCAEQDLAPKILAYEKLPLGWFAIAMRYVINARSIDHSPHHQHSLKWKEQLRKVLASLQSRNLVHGDLRSTNILVSDDEPDKALVIDFDWGGTAGQVRYPSGFVLNRSLWRGEANPSNTPIMMEDDIRILGKTLGELPDP